MSAPVHLLRVDRPPDVFAPLVDAVRRQGGRLGWLEWRADAPAPLPETLAAAAELGVLRSVAIGGGRAVAVKPMRGAPVLRDVVREYFRGCLAVLVCGELETPALAPAGDGWTVRTAGRERRFDTEALAAALRRHRPWGTNQEPSAP